MKRKRIGKRPALGDQLHCLLRSVSLRDQNAGAHRHAAVTSVGAMSVDLAAMLNRFEGGMCAAHQFWNRDREDGTIHGAEPKGRDRLMLALSAIEGVRIRLGTKSEAHVDEATANKVVVPGCATSEETVSAANGDVVPTPNFPPMYEEAVVEVAQNEAKVGVPVAVNVFDDVHADNIPAVPPERAVMPRDEVAVSV